MSSSLVELNSRQQGWLTSDIPAERLHHWWSWNPDSRVERWHTLDAPVERLHHWWNWTSDSRGRRGNYLRHSCRVSSSLAELNSRQQGWPTSDIPAECLHHWLSWTPDSRGDLPQTFLQSAFIIGGVELQTAEVRCPARIIGRTCKIFEAWNLEHDSNLN